MDGPIQHTDTRSLRLRPYQARGIEAIEHKLRHRKSVLAVAPTGAGKGTMAVSLLADCVRGGGRGMFLVHRREIVLDMRERLQREGIEAGVVMAGVRPERRAPVQLCSVQTLQSESRDDRYDLIVIDEAHHYAAVEWRAVAERSRGAKIVGFTATPMRSDGRTLGDVFQSMVTVTSYSELLAGGYVVPCRVLRPECPFKSDLAQGPAEAYLRYTPGAQAFVFVRSLEEARTVVEKLRAAGYGAEVVDAFTPPHERDATIGRLRAGALHCIVNFYTMTEGIDVPSVSTVVLGRQCSHEGAYLQMVGRALRAHPGKSTAVLLDLMGASFRFGFPTEDRQFRLHPKKSGKSGRHREESTLRAQERATGYVLGCELYEASPDDPAQRRFGSRRIDWSQQPLGILNDSEIARRLGVSHNAVIYARTARGIPSQYTPNRDIDWDDPAVRHDMQHLTAPAFAVKYKCNADTLRKRRKRHGIVPKPRGRGVLLDVDWDSVPLGKLSDKDIAKQLGCVQSTVHYQRHKRGIAPFDPSIGIDWDAQPLGQERDGAIASRLNVDKATVRKARQRRGIPPYSKQLLSEATIDERIDWDSVPLGKVRDLGIAHMLGVSKWTVAKERRARGIPPVPSIRSWSSRYEVARDEDDDGDGEERGPVAEVDRAAQVHERE